MTCVLCKILRFGDLRTQFVFQVQGASKLFSKKLTSYEWQKECWIRTSSNFGKRLTLLFNYHLGFTYSRFAIVAQTTSIRRFAIHSEENSPEQTFVGKCSCAKSRCLNQIISQFKRRNLIKPDLRFAIQHSICKM